MPDKNNLPVPVTVGLMTTKGTPGMAADTQQITVHFVHPTDSTQVLTATVGHASTPHYLIDQLVSNNFLAKPGTGIEYKLTDTKTGKELADHVSLAAASVAPDTTLAIGHSVTGAGRTRSR
jgi:hypothetical protein